MNEPPEESSASEFGSVAQDSFFGDKWSEYDDLYVYMKNLFVI